MAFRRNLPVGVAVMTNCHPFPGTQAIAIAVLAKLSAEAIP